MTKTAQKTRVYIDGEDVSAEVYACNLDRMTSHGVDTVTLELGVGRLDIADDGTLEIYVDLPKPEGQR